MHRFFVPADQINGRTVDFSPEQAHQLERVLRLRPGDKVGVFDGSGLEYEVQLDHLNGSTAVGQIVRSFPVAGEPQVSLTLFQSLLKRDKFEWVLQKGTEVGVARFVPVITRRTLVRDTNSLTPERLARWQRIVTEAAEQSGRGRIPEISPALSFAEALTEAQRSPLRLVAWEARGQPGLRQVIPSESMAIPVAMFVGPEGGYEAAEIEQAREAKLIPFTLGKRILRTETAAVVATALILYELEARP